MRHFLDLRDFDSATLQGMLDHAASMKAALKTGATGERPLAGKTVAMIFEKPTTRTRVSFEVGITQLGGTPLMLSAQDLQIGRGESIEDTVRAVALVSMLITIRCFAHDTFLTLPSTPLPQERALLPLPVRSWPTCRPVTNVMAPLMLDRYLFAMANGWLVD